MKSEEMLPQQFDNKESKTLQSYKNDSFNHLTHDYHFKLKNNFRGPGIRFLQYFEQGTTLLSSNISVDGKVHMLDLSSGNFRSFSSHKSSVRRIMVFNGEIITCGWDGTLRVTNYFTLKERLVMTDKLMGRCPHFNISPDGKFVFSFTYDTDFCQPDRLTTNTVRKFSLENGKLIASFQASPVHKTMMKGGSVFFFNGNFYVCCDSGYLRVFDLYSGKLVHETISDSNFTSMVPMIHHNYFLVYDKHGRVLFYNLRTNTFDYKISAHYSHIMCMCVHPKNPDIVISACSLGEIKIWKMPGFELLNQFEDGLYDPWSMVFINDRLVICNAYGEAKVYDISDITDIRYKGRVSFSASSFVVQVPDSKMFFTNDISVMDVYRNNDLIPVRGKEAEHLLSQSSNVMVLRELFGIEDKTNGLLSGQDKYTSLLPAWMG